MNVKKILLATDFSPAAHSAALYGIQLAKAMKAHALLFSACHVEHFSPASNPKVNHLALMNETKKRLADEAAFTGETFPVDKQPSVLPGDTVLAKRINSLFMGSHVISGRGKALVIQTGIRTEFGRISQTLKTPVSETAFEKGIRQFGYLLMQITLVLVVLIFGANVLHGRWHQRCNSTASRRRRHFGKYGC